MTMATDGRHQLPRIVVQEISTRDEMEEVYLIRDEIFVHEQALTNDARFDPDDRRSIHFLAYLDDKPVGTGRLTILSREAQVAWVAVREPFRKHGVGQAVMTAILERARDEEADYVVLNAQSHALDFYRGMGFDTLGGQFRMGGISHQVMLLGLTSGGGDEAKRLFGASRLGI
ncbi:GNAT family N-acetyltransferase [soil metagenome]